MTLVEDQMEFKTSMLKCWCEVCIVVKETITISRRRADTAAKTDERTKEVIFENGAPFTRCISEINNAQVDSIKDLDIVMLVYNVKKQW